MAIKKKSSRKPVIDLNGPQGNAFFLLGTAKNIAKQLGFSKEESDNITKEMMSGDYENLVTVFDKNFGEFIDLER